MSVAEPDLWTLTRGTPQVDPVRLAAAVEREALGDRLDFRTRLLIRDSVNALIQHWGPERVGAWLRASPASARIEAVRGDDLGAPGFPTLASRLMETTTPDQILSFLRELGTTIHRPARIHVGGSAALIALGVLSRHTDDIDVVDEVPAEVRGEHDLLERLSKRYGLYLAHFQSHYLPSRWEQRVRSLGTLGRLEVFAVDVYDIAVSKLFSSREKDRDDLRLLASHLDKDQLATRLREDGKALAGEGRLREAATKNWYIVYGEPLPS
jgi:hypothetical protein